MDDIEQPEVGRSSDELKAELYEGFTLLGCDREASNLEFAVHAAAEVVLSEGIRPFQHRSKWAVEPPIRYPDDET